MYSRYEAMKEPGSTELIRDVLPKRPLERVQAFVPAWREWWFCSMCIVNNG